MRLRNAKGLKLLFILVIAGFIISSIFILGYTSNIQDEYPRLDFLNELKGSVSKVSSYQSVVLVEFEDGRKSMIIDSRNYVYDSYLIQDFLKVGDYLDKRKNSDTLVIRRNEKEFIFVIGKELNQALNPNSDGS